MGRNKAIQGNPKSKFLRSKNSFAVSKDFIGKELTPLVRGICTPDIKFYNRRIFATILHLPQHFFHITQCSHHLDKTSPREN